VLRPDGRPPARRRLTVRALDGPDLFHLAQERPGRPMHTLKVAVLERPVPCADLDQWAAEVVPAVEPLRRALVGLPAARPVWVDGGPPHLRHHVRHVALPAPGGERELTDLLGELCAEPLDRSRPPWLMWHVGGLAGDRDALVLQVHHVLADGGGSVALWEALADGGARSHPAPEPVSRRRLAAATLTTGSRDLARLPGIARRFARQAHPVGGDGVVALPFTGPPTPFNVEPDPGRCCTFARLDLPRVHAARAAVGATLTETVLSLAGRAVHRQVGADPGDSLTATVPAALPTRGERYGNAVTTLYVDLQSGQPDPVTRLGAVRRNFAASRRSADRDPRLLPDAQRLPRLYRALVKGMELDERRRGRPAYNLTISTVRGPAPFSLAGVPVAELRSLGPLIGHLGLNITGWTYGDDLVVGIHAYASAGSGLSAIGDLLVEELEALEAAASGPAPA